MQRRGRLVPVFACSNCHYCEVNESGKRYCSATDSHTVIQDPTKEPPDSVCPFDLTHLAMTLRESIECNVVTTFQELRLGLLQDRDIPESNDAWNIVFFSLKNEYGFIETKEDLVKLHDKFEAVWNQEQERLAERLAN